VVPYRGNGRLACDELLSLAAFEHHAGFAQVARELLDQIGGCYRLGRCSAPQFCGSSERASDLGSIAGIDPQGSACAMAAPGLRESPGAFDPIDTMRDDKGNRISQRTESLASLRARGGNLSELLCYWEHLWHFCGGMLSDLDPIRLHQMGILGNVHLVNTRNDDPDRFFFEIRALRAPAVPGTCTAGMLVREHPVAIVARNALREYHAARRGCEPRYALVESQLLGADYRYRRLVLPLTTDGRIVDRLLVAVEF